MHFKAETTSRTHAERASLTEVVKWVYDVIRDGMAAGEDRFDALDEVEECVSIKNSEGVLVYCNTAHRQTMSPHASPLGRTAHSYLDSITAQRSEAVEQLIGESCPFVELEHAGCGPDGAYTRFHACKRNLRTLGNPGLAVLSVVRVVERDEDAAKRLDLVTQSEKFRELSERDQQICRQTALGVSSRELAELFGMTTRAIELRKQKAFAHLGVDKAVDLTRLLVRLQDRGYLDLGL